MNITLVFVVVQLHLYLTDLTLFLHVCGFGGNKTLMKYVEVQCQIMRQQLRNQSIVCLQQYTLSVQDVMNKVSQNNNLIFRLIKYFYNFINFRFFIHILILFIGVLKNMLGYKCNLYSYYHCALFICVYFYECCTF